MTNPVFAVRGFNVSIFSWRGESDFRQAMAPVKQMGVNTLILDVPFTQAGLTSSQVSVETGTYANLDILRSVVQTSRDLGFDVWVKPVLFPGGSDGGNYQWSAISPQDPATWFATYTNALQQVLAAVAPSGVSAILLGNELKTVATNASFRSDWLGMISSLRAQYSGLIGYNATAFIAQSGVPEEFANVVFTDALDFLGLSSYPKLYTSTSPTLQDLLAGWRSDASGTNIVSVLRSFISEHPSTKLVFSELGSAATDGGNHQFFSTSNETAPENLIRDLSEQALFFDAALSVLSREFGDQIQGSFPFRWGGTTQFGQRDVEPSRGIYTWDLQGKPAATVIGDWFSGARTSTGVQVDGLMTSDVVGGGFYDDVLKGGTGNDLILGGQGNDQLNGNGLASPASVTLKIIASGAIYQGLAPVVDVEVNGQIVGTIDVAETTSYVLGGVQSWNGPTTYEFSVSTSASISSLRLVGKNWDGVGDYANRNFFINEITLSGITLPTSGQMKSPSGQVLGTAAAIFDRGALLMDASAYNIKFAESQTDNDRLMGGSGNDTINGEDGRDTAEFSGTLTSYTVTRSGSTVTVQDNSGSDGTDSITNVERLKFSNGYMALDVGVNESAGQTALLLGAVLPSLMVFSPSKQALLGAVISLFDAGYSMNALSGALLRLPIWSVLVESSTPSNVDIATYLLTNVYGGQAPDSVELAAAVHSLNTESSQGEWLANLALGAANQSHIGLLGLAQSGLTYA